MLTTYAIVVLLLPLFAFTIQIFFGRRLPRQGDWLCVSALFGSFFFSLPIFFEALRQYNPHFKVAQQWEWARLGDFKIAVGIHLDNLTAVMLVVVSLVSAVIHLYSVGYMHGDPRYARYFAYLSFFSFAMLGLVLVDNFLAIYMFWELVGLGSYLLIGFWFERDSASNAAKKAFITTRLGDVGMFVGILILYRVLGTFNFEQTFSAIADGKIGGGLLTAAGVLVFCGAVGKSAQFPLHVWLPDAMEGPTPVSALIHSATMVAAGVYLVGRTFLLYTADALLVIAFIGAITAFMAATIAITQVDIKRVLAYSTISQLGYMMVGLGVGGYTAGLFHLTTHAFFKPLLFLCSGSVIHALHTQDMREMGGLRKKMPVTFWTMLIGTLALSGVPFFAGFYSKDAILAVSLAFGMEADNRLLMIPFLLALISAAITPLYMFRLIYLTFTGEPRERHKYEHAHESPAVMLVPMMVLAALAISSGWGHWYRDLVQKPSLANYASTPVYAFTDTRNEHAGLRVGESKTAMEEHPAATETEHKAHTMAMVLSLVMAATGIVLATFTYLKPKISAHAVAQRFKPIYNLLWRKYYFDELYGATAVAGSLAVSRLSGLFDLKIIDGAVNGTGRGAASFSFLEGLFDLRVVDGVVNFTARIIGGLAARLRGIQTGRVQAYILMALAGVIVIFIISML